MDDYTNLRRVISHLQEVRHGLDVKDYALVRANLIGSTSKLTLDSSGHALAQGFVDRPGVSLLDRQLGLLDHWQAWSSQRASAATRKSALATLSSEVDIMLAHLQTIIAPATS